MDAHPELAPLRDGKVQVGLALYLYYIAVIHCSIMKFSHVIFLTELKIDVEADWLLVDCYLNLDLHFSLQTLS